MEQKEELLIQKRFIDLSRLADRKNRITYSNFLNLNELNLFYQSKADIPTVYQLSGGYEFAERQMIAFIPDALSYADSIEFPIICLHFYPSHLKFADKLTHRDILGALINLGIERSRIGDIRLKEKDYYIFCEESISDYLLENLCQIRHTMVEGERTNPDIEQLKQQFEILEGIVASKRIDNIVAFAVRKSRSQSVPLIRSQKVFVNDCVIQSNSYLCKAGDVISVRGYGKFIYVGDNGETKKGRMKVQLKKYK